MPLPRARLAPGAQLRIDVVPVLGPDERAGVDAVRVLRASAAAAGAALTGVAGSAMVPSMADGARMGILKVHVWVNESGELVGSASGKALSLAATAGGLDGQAITELILQLVGQTVAWDTKRSSQRAAGGSE